MRFFVIGFFSLFLIACSESRETKSYIKAIQSKESQNKEKTILTLNNNRNPFVAVEKPYKISNNPLQNSSIETIKIVGILEKNHRFFAIVRLVHDKLYSVEEGNILGKERAKIIQISKNGIIAVNNKRRYQIDFF